MPKKEAHILLLEAVKQVKIITPKHEFFINLIEQGKYSEALLMGSIFCTPEDGIQLKLIEVLLTFKDPLSVDLNKLSSKGYTPAYCAAINRNINLFYLLDKSGADVDRVIEKTNARNIITSEIHKTISKLFSHFKPEYMPAFKVLDDEFAALPKTEETGNSDLIRLRYLLNAINHLSKYHSDPEYKQLFSSLDSFGREALHIFMTMYARKVMVNVYSTLCDLSPALHKKYNKHFEPAPFTWITFEHLAARIKNPPEEGTKAFMLPAQSIILDKHEQSPLFDPSTTRLFREISYSEDVVFESITTIVQQDLPLLKNTLEKIHDNESNGRNDPIKPVALVASKAITRYIGDMHSINRLLNLINYTENEPLPIELSSLKWVQMAISTFTSSPESHHQRRLNLDTKRGKHAALRRFQLIGELFTGRNFSSSIFEFDKTVDWRAFINIRDGLTHQDEKDNKFIVNSLLANHDMLHAMVSVEMAYFLSRLHHIISCRESHLGPYELNAGNYWSNILKIEEDSAIKKQTPPNKIKLVEIKRRVTQEQEEAYCNAMQGNKVTPEIQLIIDRCHGIFDGTDPDIPDKKEIGKLLTYLPSKKENKKLYEELAEIMTIATKKPRTTAEERRKEAGKLEAEAKQRELDAENMLVGLDNIRAISKKFSKTEFTSSLTPLDQVNAAIEALYNIKEYLSEIGYFVPNMPFRSLAEWDDYHTKNDSNDLGTILANNSELNDAFEYNAGQLLQHLNVISKFNEARFCTLLREQSDSLQSLRNYLAHGNLLLDCPEYELTSQGYGFGSRQRITTPLIITLIFELYPDLLRIQAALVAPVNCNNEVLTIEPSTIPVAEQPKPQSAEEGWSKLINKMNIQARDSFFQPASEMVNEVQQLSESYGNKG